MTLTQGWEKRSVDSITTDDDPIEVVGIINLHMIARRYAPTTSTKGILRNFLVLVGVGLGGGVTISLLTHNYAWLLLTIASPLALFTLTGLLHTQWVEHTSHQEMERIFHGPLNALPLVTLKRFDGELEYTRWRQHQSSGMLEALDTLLRDDAELTISEAIHAARALGAS